MARIVKRKRRRLSFVGKCTLVMSFALVSWLFVSVYVGAKNTNLTVDIQKKNLEVAELKVENQQLTIDIQTLQNKDRVYTIAKESGLDQNQDNVISVAKVGISEAE